MFWRKLCPTMALGLGVAVLIGLPSQAQPPGGGGQGGGGRPGGMGFGGMPGGTTRKILATYDKDKNGWLDAEERKTAREGMKNDARGGGGGRMGGPGMRGNQEPPKPGAKMSPDEVKKYSTEKLYDSTVLRTIFLDFDEQDWEKELEEFHGTDADVACTMTVDGKKYSNVGIHFRGMSSYMGVGTGFKRSLNLDLNMADKKQNLLGYKSLNLLNSHDDASFLSTVLYSHIANQYLPTPKANFVRVVINGENWGIYGNVQQFNKDFTKENYKTDKGARWKVRGSPQSSSGLEYTGDRIEDYKRKYEIKTKDNDEDWKALINFCKVLNQTPPDKLEEALRPIADVDEILWFLALDNALINCDGYWIRSSDYTIFRDDKGKFHIIPHDMNEAFRPAQGPGMGGMGGPGGGRGGPGGGGQPGGGGFPGGPGGGGQPGGGGFPGGPGGGGQPGGGGFPGGPGGEQFFPINQPPEGGFPGGPGGGGQPGGGGFPGGPGGQPPGAGGPPGMGGGMIFRFPQPGEIMPPMMQDMLGLNAEQRKALEKLQKETDEKLAKILTEEQRKKMKEMKDAQPMGGVMAMGGPGGGRGGSVDLDPLVGPDDARKPLRSKLFAVKKFREQYLKNVKQIATEWLDWKKLGPVVAQYVKLIEKDVEKDTRKLSTYEAFKASTSDNPQGARGRDFPLKTFADQRRKYLLDYVEGKKPTP